MKRIFVIVALVTFLSAGIALYGETARGLGLHFGTVSANGFSYRQFTGKNGFQATLGGITFPGDDYYFSNTMYGDYNGAQQITVKEDGRTTDINVGLNYLRSLANNPTGRFYIFGGASYRYSRVETFEQDYTLVSGGYGDTYEIMNGHPMRTGAENRGYYFVGAGMGFELNLGRGFKWAIEMPLTVNEDGNIMMYIPQSGLYYYFD
jgi:hypothetical protein